MAGQSYSELLRDPRWQKKRLEILQRDGWRCQGMCLRTDRTLHVHHRWYEPERAPWDYPDDALITLCEHCHEYETQTRRLVERELLRLLRRDHLAWDLRALTSALERFSCRSTGVPLINRLLLFLVTTPASLDRLIQDQRDAYEADCEHAEREMAEEEEQRTVSSSDN